MLACSKSSDWKFEQTVLFDTTLAENLRIFPDLKEKMDRFIAIKGDNPFQSRYGKHDGPMSRELKGFYHCHLRDDAVLVYKLETRKIVLVAIIPHSDIEGKRHAKTVKRLMPYHPRG